MTAKAAILTLMARRQPGQTICPSEAARLIAADASDWRAAMPDVHEAVDSLVAEGAIALSWKGKALPMRAGPYRIVRGEHPGS